MPKLRVSAEDQENRAIVAAIRYGMSMYSIDQRSLALAIKADRTTLYRRFNHPEDFTIGELRAISLKLHIPLENLMKGETQCRKDG